MPEEKEIIKTSDTEYNIVITPVVEPTVISRSLTIVDKEIADKEAEIVDVKGFLQKKQDELEALQAERSEAVSKGVVKQINE